MKRNFILTVLLSLSISFAACGSASKGDVISELGLNTEAKEATEYTAKVNSAVYSLLDFEDTSEAENATKGLIAAPEKLELKNDKGQVVWSQEAYSFLDDYEKAPDTVNPSLWENAKNNHAYGLFEVMDGIYQVRGYDMANLTLIEGETGWIVFDALMSVECTKAAMQLVAEHLGERPVKAVIISHTHADHFGGIRGLVAKGEDIPIIAPEGFAEYAVSENIYAGAAMSRRADYQYGLLLEASPKGRMGNGIGLGQSAGLVTFAAPTYEVKQTGEILTIDGVEMEFQLTPGTEAPAEMNTWIPSKNALWMAENCTASLHNLYTLRGAEVRDGAQWAKYITEAITRYGDKAEVVFQSHNWPHWGNAVINEYLVNTASIYKFINDETLYYINLGYTSDEISNMIKLPENLEKVWYTRQYYGTVAHDAKAVYQKYMGWYDANPVNLNPLEPTERAKKWVEYLGDTEEVLRMAKEDYEAGEYQWVAEITSVLVYADPENEAARLLCADALEQLGYQSESGAWRNAYLSGAKELRFGNQAKEVVQSANSGETQAEMTPAMIFSYIGIRLDSKAMAEENFTVNFILADSNENHKIQVKNGVLLHYENTIDEDAELTVTCSKKALLYVLQGNVDAFGEVAKIEGTTEGLEKIMNNMINFFDEDVNAFNIVEP